MHRVRQRGRVRNPLDVLEMRVQLFLDELVDLSSAVELPLQVRQSPAVTLIELVHEITASQHSEGDQNLPPVPAPETP